MKRNQMRYITLLLLAAASAAVSVQADSPTTSPLAATGPVAVDPALLIKQLGSDDPDARDAAQKQLVELGPSVIPALKKAAQMDQDPEIRSRASAALAQMKDIDENGTSYITLHVKDAPAQEVVDTLAVQARTKFIGLGGAGLPANLAGRNLTVDADHKPFWDVMSDVCSQMGVCPTLDMPGRNSIRLYAAPQNWMISPHEVVGPYWVSAAGVYRARSINLMGAQSVDDQFLVRLIVYPEPKLAITQISDFTLKEAADDAGNSLLPKPQPAGMVPASYRVNRSLNHMVDVRLNYPENPGKKIASLRGDVAVLLAQDLQQFEVDDVMGTVPKMTNPLAKCTVKASVARQGTELFRVTLECTRDGLGDDKWEAMMNRMNDIALEDADGHALTPLGIGMSTPTSENAFTGTALFSRNPTGLMFAGRGIGAQPIQPGQPAVKVGEPKKLTWNVATTLKTVTIPIELKDLPMP